MSNLTQPNNQLYVPEDLIGHDVVDKNETKIGTVDSVWQDHLNEPAFLSVKTGWFGLGKTVIVPAYSAHLSSVDNKIRVPFTDDVIKNGPTFNSADELDIAGEERLKNYYEPYGMSVPASYSATVPPALPEEVASVGTTTTAVASNNPPDAAINTDVTSPTGERMVLHKEDLVVGKRDVATGGVRLRKIVRSQEASASVDLVREEPVIERVPVNQPATAGADFTEQEIYIPLRREEAVIGKQAVVMEEVRAGKEQFTDRKNVSDTVRVEDAEIVDERKRSDQAI